MRNWLSIVPVLAIVFPGALGLDEASADLMIRAWSSMLGMCSREDTSIANMPPSPYQKLPNFLASDDPKKTSLRRISVTTRKKNSPFLLLMSSK